MQKTMEYTEILYQDTCARVAIYGTNRKEAHAILSPCVPYADASVQISNLVTASGYLAGFLKMKPVFKRYLLSDATNQIELLPRHEGCARSVIQQPPLDGAKAFLLVIFEENASYEELSDGVWRDGSGRMWIGDNRDVAAAGPEEMTTGYLTHLSRSLSALGGNLRDNCVRTWFFVRDVDNNYSGVVTGRNKVFAKKGLTSDTHFIASTGIAGQSPIPTRLVSFNAFADTSLRPGQMGYLYGKTHLNPTYEYGVAFERGTSVVYGDRSHIYISGTASIDNKGNIVAPGNIKAQTSRMLENIEVLLSEGDCGWSDVAHMIVYLRDMADHRVVSRIMGQRFPLIPTAIVLAPVCRPGWLIEAECTAIKNKIVREYEPF